jgi:hypothetical protein
VDRAARRNGWVVYNADAILKGAIVRIAVRQVADGLGDPGAGGAGGDPGQVHPAVLEFDHEQHVQPGLPNGFDGEKVTGERSGGLAAQELRPGRAAAPGRRPEPVAAQDGSQGTHHHGLIFVGRHRAWSRLRR